MAYQPNNEYPQRPQTSRPGMGYSKPAFKKSFNAPAKKKKPVNISQTSKVQDMFLESMKDQGIEILIQMQSGKEFSGKVSHFDRYIIILDPVKKPKVIYKSGIESIQVIGDISVNTPPQNEENL
jgi:RNA chaperone Hfq